MITKSAENFIKTIFEGATPEIKEQAGTLNAAWKTLNERQKTVTDVADLLRVSRDQFEAAKSYFERQQRIYSEMLMKEQP